MNVIHQKIRSPLKAEDWDRVLRYSKCIKEFDDDWYMPDELDPSVLESLVISLPPGSLLPNVRDLTCQSESALFPYLAILVGPHITKIFIEHTGPFWRFAALPLLASKCRSLRHVSTRGPWDDGSTEWISAFVVQLTQLRTLDVLTVNEEACRYISGLHHLETLALHYIAEHPFPRADLPSSTSPFPALRSLDLQAANHKRALNFMTALHNAPLQTLSVSLDDSSTSNSVAFLSKIHSYISPCHLTSIALSLWARFYDEANRTMYLLTSDVVRPLLAFPNLREVRLSSQLGFCLDDNFVHEMALAWSKIEHLSIHGGASNPSIMALHFLSRYCPRLQHLSLTADASNVEMDHPSGTPRVIQSALTFWDAQHSPMKSPIQVADLLSSIFPSLSAIYGSVDPDEWKQVENLVPTYAAIRAHERQLGMATLHFFLFATSTHPICS
jgi:hypothetical protein